MALKSETRPVHGFSEVVLRAYGKLIIEQTTDPQAEGISVEADEELLPRISTEVRGRRLLLGFAMPWYEWIGYWFTWLLLADKHITYRLVALRVEDVAISGSGTVQCTGLNGDNLRLRISGSGRVSVGGLTIGALEAVISGSGRVDCEGSAQSIEARISGSGRVEAEALAANRARAHISGSGRIGVDSRESLEVWISGAGKVRYRGNPRVSSHVSGAGRIVRVA